MRPTPLPQHPTSPRLTDTSKSSRYRARHTARPAATTIQRRTLRAVTALLAALALSLWGSLAQAFCGFYVGKADASLFNEASQVILVRDGNRTVLSMLNDYQGELTEFALVVPVPHVLQRGQVNVGDRTLFDRIDAYSSPRLAEYFDGDPCAAPIARFEARRSMAPVAAGAAASSTADKALGVKVEASYTVGEYDIVMLSATESDGLQTWLQRNGYRIPDGAAAALAPYIAQGMKFFVARVNIKEQARSGFTRLRPLQFAFDSPKFMLPMRLGMLNARGPQDLIVYALTRGGRVESTNYRTVKLPANVDLPVFVRGDFGRFYKSLFDRQAQREQYRAVFTEYVWDMGWCDPCAADPLSPQELRQAGVFWLNDNDAGAPGQRTARPVAAAPVMLTRLHVRYTRDTFPEDLVFQQTGDRANFQTRYVLRHPFKGARGACEAAHGYYEGVARRQDREAQTLAELTGWEITDIRARIEPLAGQSDGASAPRPAGLRPRPWWEGLWPSTRQGG